MKVALAQMNVRLGQPENNVNKMLNMIERAKSDGCDIIAFPEMCIGGYLLSDRWLDPELCRELMRYNEILKDSSEDIVVIYGNVYFDEDVYKKNGWHPNKDGRIRRYNAAYAYYNKKPVKRVKKVPHIPLGIQPKTLLPNYRLFDDDRYFFSLQDLAIDFNIPLEKMYYPFIIE